MHPFVERLGIRLPIIQAPMAGVSTPAMAAAVSNAGALGSIGVGATDVASARAMIEAVRTATGRPFNVNVFCHGAPRRDAAREAAWLERLQPLFARFGAEAPRALREIYQSFVTDHDMQGLLIEEHPAVVSFHFGLPEESVLRRLQSAGCILLGTATSLPEARMLEAAGIDAIVAQGYEAGGHRGVFDPLAKDDCLQTTDLTELLVRECQKPIIAAGGIMNGADIRAMLDLGAAAAQLGTAFIACAESAADQGFRAALFSDAAHHTIMTSAISGRPARCLENSFTRFGATAGLAPDYPITYDAGKALHAAAKARGDFSFGAQWAGAGARHARTLGAAALIADLERELDLSNT